MGIITVLFVTLHTHSPEIQIIILVQVDLINFIMTPLRLQVISVGSEGLR